MGDEAAEAGGVGEFGALAVQGPRLLGFPLLEEREEHVVLGVGKLVGVGGGGGGVGGGGGNFGGLEAE